ncbi:MAG: hypothetical protein K2I90_11175, partial [Odoribacter sp.]|nr:hypothetical protein [Odoribacter sp.]
DVGFSQVVTQSQLNGEDNLEYLWVVSHTEDGERVVDSVTTKELTLTFPAKKSYSYSVTFRLTDVTTDVSTYAALSMRTVNPYMDGWMVLNGEAGQRHLSAIEDPDSLQYIYTENAWTDMGNEPRFQDAIGLIYSPIVLKDLSAPECLYVMTPDSLFALDPFAMQVKGTNKDFLPGKLLNEKHELRYGLGGGPKGGVTLLVDGDYNFYYTTSNRGGVFEEPYLGFVKGCRASKLAMSTESNTVCIWDDDQKKFMYLPAGEGSVREVEDKEYDWTDKEVVWMGLDNVLMDGNNKNRVALALVKDKANDYWTYHFDADGNKFTRDSIGKLSIDEHTQFATSQEFPSQFFYTVGSKLYRYNVAGREAEELYDAGAPITRLRFRINEPTSINSKNDFMRYLGMVVDKGAEGELHEVVLSTAGDVEDIHVFTGFGPIQDICFTLINRVVL